MSDSLWKVYTKKADFKAIAAEFNIDQVTARIIRNRDIIEFKDIKNFLEADINSLYAPFLMKDMREAVDIIKEKIRLGLRIRIIGDYDIDGVCSSVILMKSISSVGGIVDYDIPHRITDGYGINIRLIDKAIEEGIDTIITCDNGIAAYEQTLYAKEKGLTVIITDHHEIPFELGEGDERQYILPPADAVVDHKRADCSYPYKELCGAGIAFKLAQALDIKRELFDELLKLAAFATIGDVVELKDENRIIVKNGLMLINEAEAIGNSKDDSYNHGLASLIEKTGIKGKYIYSYHVGFILGPCINAGGRLSHASIGVELFMAKDMDAAQIRAGELKDLNDQRKSMTELMTNRAIKSIEEEKGTSVSESVDDTDKIIVVYIPECHESIAGIVAGRLKEKYYRPSIVITDGDGCVKGSARSISGYHIYEELNKCSDILERFGGHAMAAGFSMKIQDIDRLRKDLNNNCELTDDQMKRIEWIDVPMPTDYVRLELVEELARLEPFGTGNPKPVFADKELKVESVRILGNNKNVLSMTLKTKSGNFINAVKFINQEEKNIPSVSDTISILYEPKEDEYRGNGSVQIVISDIIVN